MNKLLRGELKKTLLKPTVYILAAFLIAILVLSMLIYEPNLRSNSISYMPEITGSTLDEVKNSVGESGNVSSAVNSSITTLQGVIDFYNNPANLSAYAKIYSTENKQTLFKNLKDAVDNYNKVVNSSNFTESNLSDIRSNIDAIRLTSQELETAFNDMFSSNIVVIMSTNNYTTVVECLTKLKSSLGASSSTLTLEQCKAINQVIIDNNYIGNIETAFSETSDINIESKFLTTLSTQIDALKTRLTNFKIKNIDSLTKEKNSPAEGKKAVEKYYATFYNGKTMVSSSLTLELFKDLSDQKVRETYKADALLSLVGSDITKNFYQASLKETNSLYSYLYTNNLYDFDYNFAYSTSTTIATNGISGLDFTFFSLQLASLFIIIACVVLVVTSIAGEYSNKTIKLLVARPHSRSKIVSAKVLSSLIVGLILLLFSAVATIIAGGLIYNWNFSPMLSIFNSGKVFAINPILLLLISLACSAVKIWVFTEIASFFATLTKSGIASLLISLVLVLGGPMLGMFLTNNTALSYIPFFNLDLFTYFGGAYLPPSGLSKFVGPMALQSNSIWITGTFALSTGIIFSMLTKLIFSKRDIH